MAQFLFTEPTRSSALAGGGSPYGNVANPFAGSTDAAFNPYLSNSQYSPLSFQQRSATGEPLPTDFASMQSNALQSLGRFRYDNAVKVNPYQTFANFGGLNQFGFVNAQYPRVEYLT
jgi:hypothetical protein